MSNAASSWLPGAHASALGWRWMHRSTAAGFQLGSRAYWPDNIRHSMEHFERTLGGITMAPYIVKAMALIGVKRKGGSNMFRHQMSTLAILLDYKFIDPVLLKAACIHDLFEARLAQALGRRETGSMSWTLLLAARSARTSQAGPASPGTADLVSEGLVRQFSAGLSVEF